MKAAIVSALAAGVAMLGACATTTTTESVALSGGEMVAEFAAVSQALRDVDPRAFSAVDPAHGPVPRRSILMRHVLGRIEPLWKRREELRADLAAHRQSLTAEDIRTLIAEIDRELVLVDDVSLARSDVKAGISRPFLRTQYTGGDTWNRPDPGFYVTRLNLESTGMRNSEWRRIYRLKKERAALWEALRTRAVSPTVESVSASLRPGPAGRG